MRLSSGGFAAYILIGGETRAVYELSVREQTGRWRVFSENTVTQEAPLTMTFDYRQARIKDFDGNIRDLLARHSVRSVGLSAVLLSEDYQEGSSPAVVEPAPVFPFRFLEKGGAALPEEDDYTECVDTGVCTINENGCSVAPDSCPPYSNQSVFDSCQEHDRCYQCGAACHGFTRLQCDRDLRTNIAFQTNPFCAWAYFLGVRFGGWLFYQTAQGGIGFMHDVYSLGITISACEGQYAHMCTVWVF